MGQRLTAAWRRLVPERTDETATVDRPMYIASSCDPFGLCFYYKPFLPQNVLPLHVWRKLCKDSQQVGIGTRQLQELWILLCRSDEPSWGTLRLVTMLRFVDPRCRRVLMRLLRVAARRGERRILYEDAVRLLVDLGALDFYQLIEACIQVTLKRSLIDVAGVRACVRFQATDELGPFARMVLSRMDSEMAGAQHTMEAAVYVFLRYPVLAHPFLLLQRGIQKRTLGHRFWTNYHTRQRSLLLRPEFSIADLRAMTARVLLIEAVSELAHPFLFGSASTLAVTEDGTVVHQGAARGSGTSRGGSVSGKSSVRSREAGPVIDAGDLPYSADNAGQEAGAHDGSGAVLGGRPIGGAREGALVVAGPSVVQRTASTDGPPQWISNTGGGPRGSQVAHHPHAQLVVSRPGTGAEGTSMGSGLVSYSQTSQPTWDLDLHRESITAAGALGQLAAVDKRAIVPPVVVSLPQPPRLQAIAGDTSWAKTHPPPHGSAAGFALTSMQIARRVLMHATANLSSPDHLVENTPCLLCQREMRTLKSARSRRGSSTAPGPPGKKTRARFRRRSSALDLLVAQDRMREGKTQRAGGGEALARMQASNGDYNTDGMQALPQGGFPGVGGQQPQQFYQQPLATYMHGGRKKRLVWKWRDPRQGFSARLSRKRVAKGAVARTGESMAGQPRMQVAVATDRHMERPESEIEDGFSFELESKSVLGYDQQESKAVHGQDQQEPSVGIKGQPDDSYGAIGATTGPEQSPSEDSLGEEHSPESADAINDRRQHSAEHLADGYLKGDSPTSVPSLDGEMPKYYATAAGTQLATTGGAISLGSEEVAGSFGEQSPNEQLFVQSLHGYSLDRYRGRGVHADEGKAAGSASGLSRAPQTASVAPSIDSHQLFDVVVHPPEESAGIDDLDIPGEAGLYAPERQEEEQHRPDEPASPPPPKDPRPMNLSGSGFCGECEVYLHGAMADQFGFKLAKQVLEACVVPQRTSKLLDKFDAHAQLEQQPLVQRRQQQAERSSQPGTRAEFQFKDARWIQLFDDHSEEFFYHDVTTGRSQWEKPARFKPFNMQDMS